VNLNKSSHQNWSLRKHVKRKYEIKRMQYNMSFRFYGALSKDIGGDIVGDIVGDVGK
jgi:hypothetical protein